MSKVADLEPCARKRGRRRDEHGGTRKRGRLQQWVIFMRLPTLHRGWHGRGQNAVCSGPDATLTRPWEGHGGSQFESLCAQYLSVAMQTIIKPFFPPYTSAHSFYLSKGNTWLTISLNNPQYHSQSDVSAQEPLRARHSRLLLIGPRSPMRQHTASASTDNL